MKKFEMTINGEKIEWVEKTHAQVFRNFWNHFKEIDIYKTVESIKLAEIRTSDSEFFVAKNGQKKKNIPIVEGFYVYGHLTPAAMDKTYEKFLKGWNGEIVVPLDDINAMPETDDDLSTIHNEIDRLVESEKTEDVNEVVEEKVFGPEEKVLTNEQETKLHAAADAITKDSLAQEEYGVDFEDLIPTQKGKITKAYNKLIAESQEETQEEMDLPQM